MPHPLLQSFHTRSMSKEISLNITRVLNWQGPEQARVEVSFFSHQNVYLAHKTTSALATNQTLLLNTSFKVNYSPQQHTITCKLAMILDRGTDQLGEIPIDLALLAQRQLLYLPFEEQQVLEVRLYQPKKERSSDGHGLTPEQEEERREKFLQERYEFLDKVAQNETQLKKHFSDRVYNLLKDLKARNHEGRSEGPEVPIDAEIRNRIAEGRPLVSQEARGARISPTRARISQQLLINSMQKQAKQGEKEEEHAKPSA